MRFAIIPASPENSRLTVEELRLYTSSTFEANAAAYRPMRYEMGVWLGVEVRIDFATKNFSVRVEDQTSPVYALPSIYEVPVINTVALRVQAEGHQRMENLTAYLTSMQLTQNQTTGENIPISSEAVDPAAAAPIGSTSPSTRILQMFDTSATSCIDTILMRSPDAKDAIDKVIYTQRFTSLDNSDISRDTRLEVLRFLPDPVSVIYRTALQASLENDPEFATGSFAAVSVEQLSLDFPWMCRNPYVTYDWELTSRPPLHSVRRATAVGFNTPLATYTPDRNGTYQFRFSVTAPCVSDTRVTSFNARCNTVPKVDLSANSFSWNENNGMCYRRLVFNGTRSYDADVDDITYDYELITRPAVSAQELGAPDKYRVTSAPDDRGKGLPALHLFPDAIGTYRYRLTVNDGCSSSAMEAEQTIEWESACSDAGVTIWSRIAAMLFLYIGALSLLVWTQIMPVHPEHPVCLAADVLAVCVEDETARALEAMRIARTQQVVAEARSASQHRERGPDRSGSGGANAAEFKPRRMVEFQLGESGGMLLLPYVPERPFAWLAGKGDTAPVAVPAWMDDGGGGDVAQCVSCIGRISQWYVEAVRFSRRLAIVWGCLVIPFLAPVHACLRLGGRSFATAKKYRAVAQESMAGSQPGRHEGIRHVNSTASNSTASGPVVESISYLDEPDSPMNSLRGGWPALADGSLVVGGGKELTIRIPGLVGLAIWLHIILEAPILLAFVVRKNTPPFNTDVFQYFPLLLAVNHTTATAGVWSFILIALVCGSVGAGLIAFLGPTVEQWLEANAAEHEQYKAWRKKLKRADTKDKADIVARQYVQTGLKPDVFEDRRDGMKMKLPYVRQKWHHSPNIAALAKGLGLLAASVLKVLAVLSLGVMSWPAATTAFTLLECQYQDTDNPWPHWSLDSTALCWVGRHAVGSQVGTLFLVAIPFLAVVSALAHHRFTPGMHVTPMFVLATLPVKYAMAITGALYEASEGRVYADHVLQRNVEYLHDAVVLGGVGAHLLAHVTMQSLRGFSHTASNVRAMIYAVVMVVAAVSLVAKDRVGRGPGPETRGEGVLGETGGGGVQLAGEGEGVGAKELTVIVATLVLAVLAVLVNKICAASFILDRPSVIVSRGQYAMCEGSDHSGGGRGIIRRLWRRIVIGAVSGGSRRMFVIAYLGFFRDLTAEQRQLVSTGHGDAAAKSDLLVILTRTFVLLIDCFPRTVLSVRREVGAHVGLALVQLILRSDLTNRRSLLRARKSAADCLGLEKYDDEELLAELAQINARLESSMEDEWQVEYIVGALRMLLFNPDIFVGAADAISHLRGEPGAVAVDHIVADDMLALRRRHPNHPDAERAFHSCSFLPLRLWNRALLHVFAVNPARKPSRGLVDMLVNGLDGFDVGTMAAHGGDGGGGGTSESEAVSTAAIKALAAMAEGCSAEAAEVQRAVVAVQGVAPLLQRATHGDDVGRSLAGKMLQQLAVTAVQLKTGSDIVAQLVPVLTNHACPPQGGGSETPQVPGPYKLNSP